MIQKNSFNKMTIAFMTVCMILFASTAWAQTEVTVEKAGTLSSLLPESEKSAKIAGPLNGTDIKYLRDLIINHSLISLDLSEASIISGGVAYYESYKTEKDVIGQSMFTECKKLTSVVLPSTITAIGTNAFSKSGLRKIEIPNSVATLGNDAFAYSSSLATVVIGKKVSKMEQGVFYSCPVSNAYFKPMTPPKSAPYEFSSNPRIHVYEDALADYKASDWKSYGTFLGDLERTYPYEKSPEEEAAEKLPNYFEDVACTTLKAEYAAMSDEDLSALMTQNGMPQFLTDIALKIKNNTWKAYEKDFRIHSYKAYSDANYWNEKLKSSGGSYMGNPTGIYTKGDENLYVFVNDDIPSDATLYFAGCVENDLVNNAKYGQKLKKGLNIVQGTKNALYYVVYTADTKSATKKLSEWPLMNIHIEGGVVNGYYELSRHSDQDYKAILKAATHTRFTVKGDESAFNFKTATYRKAFPNSIDKSICWFDSLTVWEKELMGFCERVAKGERDFYPYNLSGGDAFFPSYYNNPNFAIEGEQKDAGWANSTTYRTSYNSYDCVSSAFDVNRSDMDDWCAAHECGHNNQGTINLEGCTEVSNNLFSNVIRFLDGMVTSNGSAVSVTWDDFVTKQPYYTRDINSRMRMYYQLYLYFHQARKNTSFYPNLFKELRKSPLSLYQTTNNDGGLKFVRTVCKVAQQDLSDFFRAWGFFEPGKLAIEDYGGHQMTVRQVDINSTLREISKYPKNREILFIEDRIDYVLSNSFPTKPGLKRRESDKVGQCGDLGQFTDYMEESPEPSNYTYVQADSLYLMSGKGGVGFLVLDSSDKMLYGSNSFSFCIPSSIGTDFTIYSVDADGTLHPTEKSAEGEGEAVVTTERASTLRNLLSSTVLKATISGPINGTDFKYLRNMTNSQNMISLDLTGAKVVSGGVAYYQSFQCVANAMSESVFCDCKKLQYVLLPESITKIAKQAFAKSGIKQIYIPDNVTTVDMDAFAYCDNLKTVIVGEKVKTMGQGVFYSSPVQNAYVKPMTPPSISSYLFSSNPIIHVHASALAKYQASGWADYGTLVGDLDEWEEATPICLPNAESSETFQMAQEGGKMTLEGLQSQATVAVYSVDGTKVAKASATNGRAELDLSAFAGKILIIQSGNLRKKVLVGK